MVFFPTSTRKSLGKNRSTAICTATDRADVEAQTRRRPEHFRRRGTCTRGTGALRNGGSRISRSAHDAYRCARPRAREFPQTLFRFVSEAHRKDAAGVGVSL